MPTRRDMAALIAAAFGARALPAAAATDAETAARAVRNLLFYDDATRVEALETIAGYDNPDLASSIIFALRYAPGPHEEIIGHLRRITGESEAADWFDWMLWQEAHPEVPSLPSYYDFKRDLFLSIDQNWTNFLKPEYIAPGAMAIRFEEVAWGGVRRDGIPSLDNPTLIAADEADYMLDDDLVFGIEINGDARAYPLRIMGWHEMFNDVIGGRPVAMAYCTLCGAGILFDTNVGGFDAPLIMGTSGFLYRSNKLMYDRTTESLWNQFTGAPVSGPLRGSGITMNQLPIVIESWAGWRRAHPDTKVLSLSTGHARNYDSGVVYQDYFASPDLMFPAASGGPLAKKDYVFGVRAPGGAKAWPLTAFAGGRVLNDRVGLTDLVLIGDADGRSVRAYERQGLTFAAATDGVSADGQAWSVREDALHGADGRRLPRVAGHVAYWFAWNNYLGPKAELWRD